MIRFSRRVLCNDACRFGSKIERHALTSKLPIHTPSNRKRAPLSRINPSSDSPAGVTPGQRGTDIEDRGSTSVGVRPFLSDHWSTKPNPSMTKEEALMERMTPLNLGGSNDEGEAAITGSGLGDQESSSAGVKQRPRCRLTPELGPRMTREEARAIMSSHPFDGVGDDANDLDDVSSSDGGGDTATGLGLGEQESSAGVKRLSTGEWTLIAPDLRMTEEQNIAEPRKKPLDGTVDTDTDPESEERAGLHSNIMQVPGALAFGKAWSPGRNQNHLRRMGSGSNGRGKSYLLRRDQAFSTTTGKEARWGFIGLGAMGYPMAKNLRSKIPKTDVLSVYDAKTAVATSFSNDLKEVALDVRIAESPRELAENSDIVITVLPEPQHVSCVFSEILATALPPSPSQDPRLYLDCSTIDPTTSRSIAALIQSTGFDQQARFVDAPMSGGVVGAQAGSLTFMVGCEPETISEVEKVLLYLGKKIWHLGPQGAGLSGKLANNYALAINNIAAAEAMNLGIKWGLDPKALGNLINSSTGRSWPSETNNPVPGVVKAAPSSRNYEGGFGVSLMHKDLRLAIQAAREAGARLELAEKAAEVYSNVETSQSGKDFSVVYQWLIGKG